MTTPRQDAIEAIREAIEECPCGGASIEPPCRPCTALEDAIDLLEGDDVIPPDGWTVVGDRIVDAAGLPVVRLRSGYRLVTLRK